MTIDDQDLQEETTENEELRPLSKVEDLMGQIQVLEVSMEEMETKATNLSDEEYDEFLIHYNELKEQRNILRRELKQLTKPNKGMWDKIPIWIYIYSIIILILYSPFLSAMIWINFASLLIRIFESALTDIASNAPSFFYNTVLILLVYALPLLGIFISWLLYIFATKKGFTRKVFTYVWIVQGLLMIGMGLWVYFNFVKGILQ